MPCGETAFYGFRAGVAASGGVAPAAPSSITSTAYPFFAMQSPNARIGASVCATGSGPRAPCENALPPAPTGARASAERVAMPAIVHPVGDQRPRRCCLQDLIRVRAEEQTRDCPLASGYHLQVILRDHEPGSHAVIARLRCRTKSRLVLIGAPTDLHDDARLLQCRRGRRRLRLAVLGRDRTWSGQMRRDLLAWNDRPLVRELVLVHPRPRSAGRILDQHPAVRRARAARHQDRAEGCEEHNPCNDATIAAEVSAGAFTRQVSPRFP